MMTLFIPEMRQRLLTNIETSSFYTVINEATF